MNRLERYLFRNAALASLVTLLGLGGMIWLSQAVQRLDLITGKGQSLLLFLHATSLVLPQLALIIIPIAVFIGVLVTLNRLNADSELIVMSAAGLRPVQMAKPIALIALIGALCCAALSLYILPSANRDLRDIITKVRADVITRLLEEGRFVELDSKIVFHYRSKDRSGALLGVLLQDRRQSGTISTFIAERGVITEIDAADYLVLSNGSMQRQTPEGADNSIVTFAQYAFDLNALNGGGARAYYTPRDRSTLELWNTTAKQARKAKEEGKVRAELHDRFASPLFVFAAAALAFAALGVPRTTRQGRGWTILAVVLVLIAARAAAFGAFTITVASPYGVFLLYGLPIGVTAISLWVVFGPRLALPRRAAHIIGARA